MAGLSVLLGPVVNIATEEGADAYFAGEGEPSTLTILPPVYSLDDFSVTVLFVAVNDPEFPSENWEVTSVTATPDAENIFNYSTTTSSVTITEQTSPFGSTWYCLMDDYSYQTFDSDAEVRAATNPAYKALVSFDIQEPYQRAKTHQFQVTITETLTLATQVFSVSLQENIYLKVPVFISRVQSLVREGS
jgi:hypothetical protein